MSFNRTNKPSPCLHCPEKGCGIKHMTCKDYIKFQAECRSESYTEYLSKRNGRYGDYRRE